MAIYKSPQFVFKISKFCNLRCGYCYEFPHLGDKTRISLDQIRAAFENIQGSISELAIESANFIWHGGEPFLLPLEFYQQVALLQKEIFGDKFKYTNSIQTNLTILTDRHLEFLKAGFFGSIGVSFDVYGDQRVDLKGRSRADLVLANMRKLIKHQIDFAAIAVLARDSLPRVKEIYRFFDGLGIKHRMLAYYRATSSEQEQRYGLSFDELIGAYEAVFHEWLASERATPVEPIKDYVRYAVRYLIGKDCERYDRFTSDRVFIIDVNGDVFNVAEAYESELCFGNLFDAPFRKSVESNARLRSIELATKRVKQHCHRCPYFGSCPGSFVANATSVERKLLNERGCLVRAMLDHILDVFERTDLIEYVLQSHEENNEAATHPALDVA
jgi:uncharacterized protein